MNLSSLPFSSYAITILTASLLLSLSLSLYVPIDIQQNSDIVGMTTTGVSMNQDLIVGLRPRIVLIEEAAEILEPQLLACLPPSVEHLILIGDHKQLA